MELRKFTLFGLLITITISSFALADEIFEKEIFKAATEIINVVKTNNGQISNVEKFVPERADLIIEHFKKYFLEKDPMMMEASPEIKDLTCSACIGGVESLIFEYKTLGVSWNLIASALVTACSVALDKEVCRGTIHNFQNEIKYILDNTDITARKFCAVVFQPKCGDWEEVNNWHIDTSHTAEKPEPIEPELPPEGSPTFKILHLSDVHMDLSYKPGTIANCNNPLCCMNTTEMADDQNNAAGFWGSFTCDLPQWTFEEMLWHIQETHGDELDYIMITGDFPAHDIWRQSRQLNLAHTKRMAELVTSIFPDKLILPTVGNHESFPMNSYPPISLDDPDFSIHWLYQTVAQYYKEWMPAEFQNEFQTFFSTHGYYTLKIKPGLRIIMVNPMACYSYNFWLSYDWQDNSGVLSWLVEILSAAESVGDKVHIISHIPPGAHDCLGAWGRNYAHIIERFENTVRAQFFGHTHNDQFLVFYDAATQSRPVNLGFVTPSVTTYTGMNPSYTIYTVDGPGDEASYRILDKEVFIMDLAKANEAGPDQRPTYSKLYDARKDLEMTTLFPKDFDAVVNRMVVDDDYYAKYFRYYNHGSEGHPDHTKREVICKMVTVSNLDESKCEDILDCTTPPFC